MARQGIADAWNYWTGACAAQTFLDIGRAHGDETIGAAVDAFVVELPGVRREWAGLDAEELEDIRDVLMSYLHLTRGVEWK